MIWDAVGTYSRELSEDHHHLPRCQKCDKDFCGFQFFFKGFVLRRAVIHFTQNVLSLPNNTCCFLYSVQMVTVAVLLWYVIHG
jgi:hypothetical protein